jgi:hypothetical protein
MERASVHNVAPVEDFIWLTLLWKNAAKKILEQ